MTVSELLRAVGAAQPGGWALASAALVLCVSASASHGAFTDLNVATEAGRAVLASTKSALHTAHVVADAEHDRREELEHDARNSLAGLRAALVTIDQYGTRLDASTMARLREAALSEVHNLEHLIVHDREEPVVDFELEAVVSKAVDVRRAAGTVVALSSTPMMVRGRPADLSTALQNVLVNAEQHGAAPISVTVARVGSHVEIDVSDAGPGIAAEAAQAVFERGAKGRGSNGSGLGLAVARELMRRQAGDLELRSHEHGCVFTILLPNARAGDALAPDHVPPQREGFRSREPGPTSQARLGRSS
jgi:signal transduction histidine kinase